MPSIKRLATLSLIVAVSTLSGCLSIFTPDVNLATNGETSYAIVKPAHPTGVDEFAVKTLATYLHQMTGAEFPVIGPDEVGDRLNAVFVGVSEPMRERLGENTPVAKLKEQEYVVRNVGPDVFLYGEGVHGDLRAVMDFLEGLGWRWYSVFEKPVVPSKPTITLKPFDRTRGFSFNARQVAHRYGYDFYLLNGINQGFEVKFRKSGQEKPPHYVSFMPTEKFVHSSFSYIPPTPDTTYADEFKWMTKRDYFTTNPDFFSMNSKGKRVPNKQLCFSNRKLRDELTKNVMKHIEVSGENQYITIDAADATDTFCHCPGCVRLEEKYKSPGGPYYDYLFELCDIMKKKHPKVKVKMLAYRRSQSQKPPVMPAGQAFPDNLIVSFAPIEDSYFADWTHPDPEIQDTYQDLRKWGVLADDLWVWIYPNPWGTGEVMPVGNVKRLANLVKKIHEAGGTGVFTDHNGFTERSGLSELQSYVLYQLTRDVNSDVDEVIEEFTDHQYGAAAPLARQYLEELEKGREEMIELPPRVTFKSSNYDDRTFPYLTVKNIHRWQKLFDQMEKDVTDDPERLLNVRLLRRELDFATLWKWFALQKAHPDYYKDHNVVVKRIEEVNNAKAPAGMKHRALGKGALQDFLAVIKGGGKRNPLPQRFANVDENLIKEFMPRNYSRRSPKTMEDPDAAFGYAATVAKPDYPFQFGFFQWKKRNPPSGNQGARLSLDKKQITPGVYKLYDLGEITVTPDSWIWFSAKSWGTHLEVGNRVFEPGADNKWRAYVSLKFDGPSYGGNGDKDVVLCDRIILEKIEK